MKKIFSLLLVTVMLFTTVFANAGIPDFLTESYTNYTADYKITMTFDNCEEIMALLEEVEMPEEINTFVDIKALLQSLFSYSETMKLQADISDDFDKVKMALTTEGVHEINFNSNLNIGIGSKMGMWLDIDISDVENPVIDMIYSHPYLNKYLVINAADFLEDSPEAFEMMKVTYNKEFMDYIKTVSSEMLMKYATIKSRGNQYTLTIDNEGFTALADEIIGYISQMVKQNMGEAAEDFEIPSIKNWKLLGEEGITCVYTLRGRKLTSEKTTMDFSLELDQIYETLDGGEWEYVSADTIDFTVEVSAEITNIGRTKVDFPELNEENSVTLDDLEPDYEYYEEYEEFPEYPNWYISVGELKHLPVIDGEVYVPLRATLEAAYDEEAKIDYNNGVITVKCKYFPGFETLTMTVDTDKIYAGESEYSFGKVFTIDGSTYVNSALFTDVFGWRFTNATHSIIADTYYYSFYAD